MLASLPTSEVLKYMEGAFFCFSSEQRGENVQRAELCAQITGCQLIHATLPHLVEVKLTLRGRGKTSAHLGKPSGASVGIAQ